MAINDVSFEIRTNAEEVINELQAIDKMLWLLNKTRTKINIDTSDIVAAQKAIDELQSGLSAIQKEHYSINIDTRTSTQAEESINTLQKEIDNLNSTKISVDTDTTNQDVFLRLLETIAQELKSIDNVRTEVKMNYDEIINTQKMLDVIANDLKALDNIKTALKLNYDEIINAQKLIENFQERLDELEKKEHKVTISTNLEDIGNTLDNIGKKMLDFINPLSGSIGNLVSSLSVFKLLDSAFDTLTSHMDDAISRFDTLQRYPKVLSALGHSTESTTAAVQELASGIEGLPTALDEIVAINQRITSITGDLDRSTKLTLALNNAFLASGASVQDTSRGFTQFIQQLSNNEVDLRSWRTLMESMPVSLTKVANSFKFFGDNAMLDLYNAIHDGDITFRQFSDRIIELGYDMGELANLAKINSAGIGTSFNNLSLAITKGLANLMTQADEFVQRLTGKNIAENIDSIKFTINSLFQVAIDNFYRIEPFLESTYEWFISLKDTLKNFDWGSFGEGIAEGFTSLKTSFEGVMSALSPLIDGLKSLITAYGGDNFAKGLGKLPALYLKIAIGLRVLGKALKIVSKFTGTSLFGNNKKGGSKTSVLNVSQMLNQVKNLALLYGYVKTFGALVDAIGDIDKKLPSDIKSFTAKIINLTIAITAMGTIAYLSGKVFGGKNVKNSIAGIIAITAIALELILFAEALKQFSDKVPSDIETFAKKIANMAIAITAMSVLIGVLGVLIGGTGIGVVAAIAGIIAVTAIALELMLFAEAIKQLDEKVPSDIETFAKKVANLAIVIGAMTVLVAVIGALIATGVGALIAVGGLLTIAAFALELMLIAEAIQQFDQKVPSYFEGVQRKIEGVVNVLNTFRDLLSTNLLQVLGDLFAVLDIAVILSGINLLKKVAIKLNEFADIDISPEIGYKLGILFAVLDVFKGQELDTIINDVLALIDFGVLSSSIDELIKIANKLRRFEKIQLDYNFIAKNIEYISDTLELIYGGKSIFLKLKKTISDAIDSGTYNQALKTIETLYKISLELRKLGNVTVNYEKLNENLIGIDIALDAISGSRIADIISNIISTADLNTVAKTLVSLRDVAKELAEIAKIDIDFASARRNINSISFVFEAIERYGIFDILDKIVAVENYSNASKAFQALNMVAEQLDVLSGFDIDYGTAKRNLNSIGFVIQSIERYGIFDILDKMIGIKNFEGAAIAFSALVDVASELEKIAKIDIDYGTAKRNINSISFTIESIERYGLFDILEKLIGIKNYEGAVVAFRTLQDIAIELEKISQIDIDFGTAKRNINSISFVIQAIQAGDIFAVLAEIVKIKEFSAAINVLTVLQDIAVKIEEISKIEIDYGGAVRNINSITFVIERLQNANIFGIIETIITSLGFERSLEAFDKLIQITQRLQTLSSMEIDYGTIIRTINSVEFILQRLASFPELESTKKIDSVIESFVNLVNTLRGMDTQFYSIGSDFGGFILDGFISVEVPTKIMDEIRSLIRQMLEIIPEFTEVGIEYGTALNDAFGLVIETMHLHIDNQIAIMKEYKGTFSGIGTTYGQALTSSFSSAIANMASAVGRQVTNIQRRLNSLKAPSLTVDVNTSGNGLYRSKGGPVDYLSKGGAPGMFAPKGTDRIPAMLTRGEYVHNKKAVNTFGIDFMNAVNKRDISGTFKALTGRFNTGNTVVNNYHSINNHNVTTNNHTTNANVTQHINGGGNMHSARRFSNTLRARSL